MQFFSGRIQIAIAAALVVGIAAHAFFYKVRLAPPHELDVWFETKTKDNKAVRFDSKVFFYGKSECISLGFPQAVRRVVQDKTLVGLAEDAPGEFVSTRKEIRDHIPQALLQTSVCTGTDSEVFGYWYFLKMKEL